MWSPDRTRKDKKKWRFLNRATNNFLNFDKNQGPDLMNISFKLSNAKKNIFFNKRLYLFISY